MRRRKIETDRRGERGRDRGTGRHKAWKSWTESVGKLGNEGKKQLEKKRGGNIIRERD